MPALRMALLIAATTGSLLVAPTFVAAESPTGWDRRVLPSGTYRQQISKTPIPQRPGRPLHIYGNTVRMLHQRDQMPIVHRPLRRFLVGTDKMRQGR